MPTKLSVNLNAVAQLRNRRDLPWPNVVAVGRIALQAGAIGLTVHPRPDERHIRRTDVHDLAALLREPAWEGREFNIEGYPTEDFLQLIEEVRPIQATLVPDDPAQATSDHGWEIDQYQSELTGYVTRLKKAGSRVALFIDAVPARAVQAARVGADRVEIFTGPYGAAYDDDHKASEELRKISETVDAALAADLQVNAGHDLTLANLPKLVTAAPGIVEVSIGHCLTADALLFGYDQAVRRYIAACS